MVLAGLWLVKVNALALTALTWLHMSKHSMLISGNAMNVGRSAKARNGKEGG